MVVGGDALSAEPVSEACGDGGDTIGELSRSDLALSRNAVGVGEDDGGPIGAAAGVDLLELEVGGGPPDFGV